MTAEPEDFGPAWTDPDAARRTSALLRRLLGSAMLVVFVGPVAAGLLLSERDIAAQRDAELALAAVLSLAPRSAAADVIDASGRRAWFVSEQGTVQNVGAIAPVDAEWRAQVSFRARNGADHHFVTEGPGGARWLHTTVAAPGGSRLVIARPMDEMTAIGRFPMWSLIGVGALSSLAVAAAWVVLHRRIARPLGTLVDAGDDLRVRGLIRDDIRAQLGEIGSNPLEVQRLAEVMLIIEADSVRTSAQATKLLQAAGALGGSLDLDQILELTLEHLHQLLDIDRSMILRYDARLEAFEIVAGRGHTDAYIADVTSRSHDPTVPSLRALREGSPVQVPDTEAVVITPTLRERARRHGYRAILAVPLDRRLEAPTVLLLHTRRPRTFSFDEVEVSKSFASIAGAALRNAELFRRTDARLDSQTSRLRAIVESVDEGLLVESGDARVLFANSAFRRLLPEPGVDIREWTIRDLLALVLTGCDTAHQTMDRIEALSDQRTTDTAAWCDVDLRDQREGRVMTFRVRPFSVRDDRGTEIGRGQTWLDISKDRELEQMKSGLLATVSHEFRTPLALIKGYASTLLAEDVTWHADDQRDFLRLVSAEADRLTALVQGILDMRRIDAGMVTLQVMPVRLAVVVQNAVDGLPHDRHRIDTDEIPEVTLEVDTARVVTALRNLLENACKYSPSQEPVTIRAVVRGDEVEVVVRDRGRGVDPRLSQQIFETFVRGHEGLGAEHGGIGLGLPIARGFVEAHGGRLWTSAPDNGGGAEFHCSLPLHQTTKVLQTR